jgi:hypothetical protein
MLLKEMYLTLCNFLSPFLVVSKDSSHHSSERPPHFVLKCGCAEEAIYTPLDGAT